MEIMEHPQTDSTDLLLSLPPELVLAIFSFIGVKNFNQDVRRLAVCKKWYAYARPFLLSSLCLHTGRLGLWPKLRALRGHATLAEAQQLTKHIDLTLKAGVDYNHLPFFTISELEELASKLKDFAALRTLTIRPERAMFIMPVRILSSFATLHQLTSLELDLANVAFGPSPAPHLCEYLSQLIPSLKRLRCRLPRICNDLLRSPPGDLEELIISISTEKRAGLHPRRCSMCTIHDFFPYDGIRTSMETGLLQFATSMHDPKIVRLIHNIRYGDRKIYAFDAIENRRLFLGTSTTWDADGVLLPEDWDESVESDESGESDESEDWQERYTWEENEHSDEEASEDEEVLEHDELPEDE